MPHQVVAISDLHGTLPEIPACDLLLIAGDICPIGNHGLAFQANWLQSDFRRWLQTLPARKIIYVAGNHDLVFERAPHLLQHNLPATYLQDGLLEWEGLRIWGTPWQPWFFDWAFNLHEPDLQERWALIPEGTDIVVVHGPPHGYGDGVPELDGLRRTGSPSLLERIRQVGPKLVVFGHIHEGRGSWYVGGTLLANVTILDAAYRHVYKPWRCLLGAEGAGSLEQSP